MSVVIRPRNLDDGVAALRALVVDRGARLSIGLDLSNFRSCLKDTKAFKDALEHYGEHIEGLNLSKILQDLTPSDIADLIYFVTKFCTNIRELDVSQNGLKSQKEVRAIMTFLQTHGKTLVAFNFGGNHPSADGTETLLEALVEATGNHIALKSLVLSELRNTGETRKLLHELILNVMHDLEHLDVSGWEFKPLGLGDCGLRGLMGEGRVEIVLGDLYDDDDSEDEDDDESEDEDDDELGDLVDFGSEESPQASLSATEVDCAFRMNLQNSAKKEEVEQDSLVELDDFAKLNLEHKEEHSGRADDRPPRRKFRKLNEQYSQQAYQEHYSTNSNGDRRAASAGRAHR